MRKLDKSGLVGGKRGKCKWGGKFFLLLETGVGSFFLFSGKLKRRFLW